MTLMVIMLKYVPAYAYSGIARVRVVELKEYTPMPVPRCALAIFMGPAKSIV